MKQGSLAGFVKTEPSGSTLDLGFGGSTKKNKEEKTSVKSSVKASPFKAKPAGAS